MMIYPVFQFGAAVIVIALLILILGLITEGNGKPGIDVLGVGLSGTTGAATFLAIMGTLSAAVFFGFRFVVDNVAYRAHLEGLALRIPAWGSALLQFAMQRFCLALRITHEAGLPAEQSVRFAFRATANAAFLLREEATAGRIKKGNEIAPVLSRSGAPFPEEFLASLTLAEATGQITEVMDRLGANYREEGIRKLKAATQITGYAIYALIGLLIVIAIFRIASLYLGMLGAAG